MKNRFYKRLNLLKTACFIISIFLTQLTYAQDSSKILETLHLDWMDLDQSPQQNFFTYANGTWQKNNPIPDDEPGWNNFTVLEKDTQKRIHDLLIKLAHDNSLKPGSIEQKIGDFYYSGMDETSINQQGLAPLEPELAKIDAINNLAQLQAEIAHLHLLGIDVFFEFGSMQDFKNSNDVIAAIAQGGIGLPDKTYYLDEGKKFTEIRAAYRQYIKTVLTLSGYTEAQAQHGVDAIMQIETALANGSLSITEQRDPKAVYHMSNRAQLSAITPHFAWDTYFNNIGQPNIKRLNIAMPLFLKTLEQQLSTTVLNDWKIYLRFHLISALSPYLSTPFINARFKLLSKLNGVKELQARWRRVVNVENGLLGFAIGEIYVKDYFSPMAKAKAAEIMHEIRLALKKDLETLSWLTDKTRKAALKKLSLMGERIGYPDKWRNYSTLTIDRGPYVLNAMRAMQFAVRRDLLKIDKPVDKNEWAMPPQAINAYYDPSMNNINIPAGILQKPFFDPNAPDAVNYGGIGFIIGHEMTHGFDDQGAKFDSNGNLNNWWTKADLQKFKQATDCIVKQFSSYEVEPNVHVNGQMVVGEATADLGGITLAYHALIASRDYSTAPTIKNFSPLQQFFLSTAHSWANNTRPEQQRLLIVTDVHPPAMFRVNGSLSNIPAFSMAFDIPDGSPMINKQQCHIW